MAVTDCDNEPYAGAVMSTSVKSIRITKPVTKEEVCYSFKCKTCGFEADTERAVIDRCVSVHSYTEKKQIEEFGFFKFESLAGIELYFEHASYYSLGEVHWKGPGWYGLDRYEAISDESSMLAEHVDIIPLAEYLTKCANDVVDYERKIATIMRVMGELKELK
jgi:hypothetical protein